MSYDDSFSDLQDFVDQVYYETASLQYYLHIKAGDGDISEADLKFARDKCQRTFEYISKLFEDMEKQ